MKNISLFLAVAAMLVLSACGSKKNTEEVKVDNAAVVMENILRAAMAAPSGMDKRPWSFVILNDKTDFDNIFAKKHES